MALRKPWKVIEMDNGKVSIYGNHHWISLSYEIPWWEKESAEREERDLEPELSFIYKGHRYFLSEFMAVYNPYHSPNPPDWLKEFDGYASDSYFSGVLVKLGTGENDEYVQVYTYIS